MTILGCGSYLPNRIVSNSDLERSITTSDEWIKSRTGISQRHLAEPDEYSSHMALKASLAALQDANLPPAALDLIIVCTTTPDQTFPATATKLQGYLALGSVPSFDIQAVCCGFIYGLQLADSLIQAAKYQTILLVGAEKMSSLLDWTDRSTCVLFGDGAGAVIIRSRAGCSGIIDSRLYSDGRFTDLLYTDSGARRDGQIGTIKMAGQSLFKHAVEKMSQSVLEILQANNLTAQDIDYYIPHQANLRIIDAVGERLKLDSHKIVKTIDKHANCSAASIPLALADLKSTGHLKTGHLILMTAIGAGLTWGSALLRW